MADEAVAAEGKDAGGDPKEAKGGLSVVSLILVVLVAVTASVGGLGGAAYYLVKSGRLSLGGSTPAKVEAAEKVEEVKARLVVLDPLLVNLADEGGKAYLRVAMTVRVVDPPPVKGAKEKPEEKPEKGKVVVNESDVLMRDAALTVLGRATGEALLAADGKEKLKGQLQGALQASVPKLKVMDVLFTDFLVQR